MAGSAVGFGVELVLLDQSFHFATRAIDLFIEMFNASGQIGDDIPDINDTRHTRFESDPKSSVSAGESAATPLSCRKYVTSSAAGNALEQPTITMTAKTGNLQHAIVDNPIVCFVRSFWHSAA